MARVPKQRQAQKSEMVHIRLTPVQRELIEAVAVQREQTVSSLIRVALRELIGATAAEWPLSA